MEQLLIEQLIFIKYELMRLHWEEIYTYKFLFAF